MGLVIFGAILSVTAFNAFKLSRWEAGFWLTVLAVWAIGASTLTYEYRKATWLFLSLVVASTALIEQGDKIFPSLQTDNILDHNFKEED